jgi:hypothetical protein
VGGQEAFVSQSGQLGLNVSQSIDQEADRGMPVRLGKCCSGNTFGVT